MTSVVDKEAPAPADLILGWDHLEFWVGNARQAAQFFTSAFGFEVVAYAGPETGMADRASYVLAQGAVRFVVTSALSPDSEIAAHVRRHGDGVHDAAVAVADARLAYESALARGGVGLCHPWTEADGYGAVARATIATYGDTQHTFVDRAGYGGPFLPNFTTDQLPQPPSGPAVGITKIDHVVANLEKGALDGWVEWYRRVLGFDQLVHFGDDQISTEYSALMSTVVWDGSKVVMPLNEPADGLKKSQIQEYLDYYGGPGVQHIALRTDDIVASVAALRARGVRFLAVPPAYYDDVRGRLGHLALPWEELARLGILVDEDDDGYLLQTFTENIGDRPTVFIEIIQRQGATGFGAGNFKALFEAIEREQARRGNL
jgi:4-hydroxyphenylpyruvate dioxygenase